MRTYYKRCNEWMLSNSGKQSLQFEVAQLFSEAYSCVAIVDKCKSGFQLSRSPFRALGIVTPSSVVFSDEDFAAADALLSSKSSSASAEVVDQKLHKILLESAVGLTS